MTPKQGQKLRLHDVVQIGPGTSQSHKFSYCFMIVTDIKTWGVQGYIYLPEVSFARPKEMNMRAEWKDIEYIGRAVFQVEED